MEIIWKEVKAAVKDRIPVHSYRMWIEPMEFNHCEEGSIILSCPNFFSKKRIQEQYGSLIESEIKRVSMKACKIVINVSKRKNGSEKEKLVTDCQLPLPNMNLQPHNGRLLRRDFTFDHFVVGGNNGFAYSAALSLASQKIMNQNALFLLSKTGMGKSHLSQAIGHYILSKFPDERVYYITAEDFAGEMVRAFRHDSIDKFKEKYRKTCDVLLIEDIHFLSGKERTQIELASTLDYLLEANKKIIFTSCYLPADIPKMSDQIISRLSCGLISNIEPPDFRTRVRIIKKKSNIYGYNIPEDVTHYLAGELSENVRQLEGGLIGVNAKASLLGSPIDVNLAESVVKNIARQSKAVTIDVIKKLVCKYYGLGIGDIVSRSRKQSVVRPRQIAIYLSRKYTDQPLQTIGKSFNRYHATAIHSISTVERELKAKGTVQKQVEYFCKKLESSKF